MYKFRREDTGEIVEVSWEVMMTQDVAGYIEIDGVSARRCWDLEEPPEAPKAPKGDRKRTGREIVSDTLGFGESVYEEYERDRAAHGFSGVRFERDPEVPQFFQVKCDSRKEYDRYVKHRGFVNRTGIGGVRLTEEDLARAGELVKRQARKAGEDDAMREDPDFAERLEYGFRLLDPDDHGDDEEDEEESEFNEFDIEVPLVEE